MFHLVACASIEEALWPEAEAGAEVRIQGYVYDSPFAEDESDLLVGASLVVTGVDGTEIGQAWARQGGPDGYYVVKLPGGADYQLRIDPDDDEVWPAVWTGRAPTRDGLFFPMWAFRGADLEDLVDSMQEAVGLDVYAGDPDFVQLWGAPADPEGFDPSRFRVEDADGRRVTVLAFQVDDQGALVRTEEPPVDFVFAFNLPPGDVNIDVLADDGTASRQVVFAEGGDWVSAWYLVLP